MNNEQLMAFKYADAFLDIIDNADEFDRGDLQGAVEAQIRMLIAETKKNLTLDEWQAIGNINDWQYLK